MSARFVAVRHEGVLAVHATDDNGNYATLCGLDGDDPGADQSPAELPKRPKITCSTCISIIEPARAIASEEI